MKTLPTFPAAMLSTIACAHADEPVAGRLKISPEQIAAIKIRNQGIISSAEHASGVFTVEDNGAIKHVQSGMICPAFFPNVNFSGVLIFSSEPGADVGCDYRRADDLGGSSAKLTIFATKVAPNANLDSAFAGYRSELLRSAPNAKSLGPALAQAGRSASDPEIRSEEFSIPLNQREYTTQLFVELKAGWVLEVRATFAGKPNVIQVTKDGGPDAAVIAMGDRLMGPLAFVGAEKSLGQ